MTARKVRQARGRLVANRLILVVLVLFALAGVYGVANGLSHPVALTAADHGTPAGRLPVVSQLLACPAPGTGGVTGGGIALATAPHSAGDGQVALTALDATAGARGPAAVDISPPPGQLTVKSFAAAPTVPKKLSSAHTMAGGLVPTSVTRGGLIVAASGSSAQGLDAEQLGPDGQPTARCQAPGSDFWFVGPNSPKLHTELYLLNTDSKSADANLSVQTESGSMIGTDDSGIVVPSHGMVLQNLDKLLHNAKDIALHVTTSTGRVVAALRQSSSSAKPGIWLPAAAEPATTQALPGLPSTSGIRELFITVPGSASARVKVTAVTPHGSYQPTGASGVGRLPHQTTGLQVPSLSGIPGAGQI